MHFSPKNVCYLGITMALILLTVMPVVAESPKTRILAPTIRAPLPPLPPLPVETDQPSAQPQPVTQPTASSLEPKPSSTCVDLRQPIREVLQQATPIHLTRRTPPQQEYHLRMNIVQAALSQVGLNKREHREYINSTFSRGRDQAWCADFASTILNWVLGPGPHFSLAHDFYQWARSVGKFTASPQPGDLILFSYSGCHIDHIAFVHRLLPNGSITTIGGNEGPDKGGTGGGGQVQESTYPVTYPYIVGFVSPL